MAKAHGNGGNVQVGGGETTFRAAGSAKSMPFSSEELRAHVLLRTPVQGEWRKTHCPWLHTKRASSASHG